MRSRAASRMSIRRCSRSPHFVGGLAGGFFGFGDLFRTAFDSNTVRFYGVRTGRRKGGGRMELWTVRVPETGTAAAQAERAEQVGWDGVAFTDSQNLIGDPFVAAALAAQATTTLRFATGVTNAYTRHPAALATTAATVQEASG